MIYPMTQMNVMSPIPWGLPQVSRILAVGILASPPMMLDMMLVADVRE